MLHALSDPARLAIVRHLALRDECTCGGFDSKLSKATLSHRSAAALWELLPYPATSPAWITIPVERSATRPRIKTIRAQLAELG